ncbi:MULTISPECIES: ABC transporter permease [Lachnospiraceae]|jgi:putative aldouronate transport system permease protein|uniref:ABC transporter permease n=1 Tax=Lachnospiraceae TaxID=186803 RepID=UPI000E50837C|nr:MULTISPECIES: ABC transporter permease subunit [Lachnospiraceae]RHR24908.1 sugar ABC transporter permease [Blautia sp. AF19-13LB]
MKKAEVKKGKKKNVLKEYWPLYLMMLPALLYLLINNYIPMAGMVIAFKKLNFAKGIWASPWAGLKNFKFLFASKDAWIITRNTLLYNVAFILVNMVVGIAIAILITEVRNTKLKKVYQSAILLPFLMSMVILSYIVYALLSAENGLVNNSILPLFHIDPIQWYQKPKYWPAVLIIANCWKGVGYGCLIYIASLIGIDPSFYEAARLDGASKWQEITKITLPSLVPTIITLLLLSIGRIFYSDFGLFYQVPMNSGVLFPTTNVIDTYVYRALIEQGNVSMSSAAGVYQSLVGFCVVMLSNWIVRKVDKDQALF